MKQPVESGPRGVAWRGERRGEEASADYYSGNWIWMAGTLLLYHSGFCESLELMVKSGGFWLGGLSLGLMPGKVRHLQDTTTGLLLSTSADFGESLTPLVSNRASWPGGSGNGSLETRWKSCCHVSSDLGRFFSSLLLEALGSALGDPPCYTAKCSPYWQSMESACYGQVGRGFPVRGKRKLAARPGQGMGGDWTKAVCHWSIRIYPATGDSIGPTDLFDTLLERCRKMQTATLHTLVL